MYLVLIRKLLESTCRPNARPARANSAHKAANFRGIRLIICQLSYALCFSMLRLLPKYYVLFVMSRNHELA